MKILFFFLFFLFILERQSELPRGVSPENRHLYLNKPTFTCHDQSKTIKFSYVNDNYCDCEDGSDEPGTSACSETTFYCKNEGFKPKIIFSNRVNDYECDCCSGEDEWETGVCENTCLIELQKEIEKEKELKKQRKLAIEFREARNPKVFKLAQQKRKTLTTIEKKLQIITQILNKCNSIFQQIHSGVFDQQTQQELQQISSMVFSSSLSSTSFWNQMSPKFTRKNGFQQKFVEEVHKLESQYQHLAEKYLQLQLFKKENLELYQNYLYLYNQVINFKTPDGEYEYIFKPFISLVQHGLKSNNDVTIGSWGSLGIDNFQENYPNGEQCWNGPIRKVLIHFECSVNSEIISIEETDRCFYEMVFKTPGACQDIDDDVDDDYKQQFLKKSNKKEL
ncbi:glucosidase 2 subunit beta [Anaeramoeba flamelloides]|uniref:Glucosidase 2 subunit beta n=1 Tax=Anaeramoeba flamelloides TaxID=1746091 RepID=A0AAV8A6N3_9EUKA|nr:glucosidase 2 subunit beta [Anaeramoeba flamelloides]